MKKANKTRQLTAIHHPQLDPVPEEKNAIKNIIGTMDKIRAWTVDWIKLLR